MKRNFIKPIRYLLLAGATMVAGASAQAYDYTGYDYVENFDTLTFAPYQSGSGLTIPGVKGTFSNTNAQFPTEEKDENGNYKHPYALWNPLNQGGGRSATFALDNPLSFGKKAVVEFDFAASNFYGWKEGAAGSLAIRDGANMPIFTLYTHSVGSNSVGSLSIIAGSFDPTTGVISDVDTKYRVDLNEAEVPAKAIRWYHVKAAIYVGYGIVFDITSLDDSFPFSTAVMLPLPDGFTPSSIADLYFYGRRMSGTAINWTAGIDNLGIKVADAEYTDYIDSLNAPNALVGKTISSRVIGFEFTRKNPIDEVDSVLRVSFSSQSGNRQALYALETPVTFVKKASVEFDWKAGTFSGGGTYDEAQITFRSGEPSLVPTDKNYDIFTIYCKKQENEGIYFALGGIPMDTTGYANNSNKEREGYLNTRKIESDGGIPAVYRADFSDAPLGGEWYHVKVDLYAGQRAAITITSHENLVGDEKYVRQAVVVAPEGWNHNRVDNIFFNFTRSGGNITYDAEFDNFNIRIADGDNVPPEGISLSAEHETTSLGGTNTITATVYPFDVTDPTTTWRLRDAADSALATIAVDLNNSQQATLTAGSTAGTVGVVATTLNDISDTLLMEISQILLDSIAISGDTVVTQNHKILLSKTTLPGNAGNDSVTWSSSDEAIAVVDAETGEVAGTGAGNVTITATAKDGSGKTATHPVRVYFSKITRIDMHGARRLFYTDDPASEAAFTITPVFTPAVASVQTLTWTSTNTAVATVTSEGVVTLTGYGKAAIEGASTDESGVKGSYYVEVAQEYPYQLFTDFENGQLSPFRTPTSTGGTTWPTDVFQGTKAVQVVGSGNGNRFGIVALEKAIEGHVINLHFDWYANINSDNHRGQLSIRTDSAAATGIKHDAANGYTVDNNLLTIAYRTIDGTPWFGYCMGDYTSAMDEWLEEGWTEPVPLEKLNKLDTWYTLDVTIDFYRSKVSFSIKERDNPEATETEVKDVPLGTLTISGRVKSLLLHGHRATTELDMHQAIDNFGYSAVTYSLVSVTLDPDGGTFDDGAAESKTVSAISGETFAGLVPDVTKENYDFLGWYVGDAKIDDIETYTTSVDVTLTAKWQIYRYTVTFTGDGLNTFSVTVDHGEYVDEPKDPERAGYEFIGWYDEEDSYWAGNEPVTSNMTLTARWEGDGDGETAVEGSVLSSLTLYPNPAKGSVTLSGLEGGEVVDFFNLSGTLLLSRKATGNKEAVDVSALPQGSYIVRVTKGRATKNLKLVVR